MNEVRLQTAFGCAEVHRFPVRQRETLRAWDAADELLLEFLHENNLLKDGSRLLIIEDQFGAFSVNLAEWAPVVLTDSFVSAVSIRENLRCNGMPEVKIVDLLTLPECLFDVVIYKLPKNLAYFEDILKRIRPLISSESQVIGAGMVKHMPKSALELADKWLGSTRTSLAQKKARLIFSQLEEREHSNSVQPRRSCYGLPEIAGEVVSYGGVFSANQLDIGTRFLLPFIPEDLSGCVVDLACGAGVIGLVAAHRNPEISLTFCDDSALAIASAKENFDRLFSGRSADFLHTDCLDGIDSSSVDTILCNPPFHQGTTVGDHIARRMFTQSKRCLKPGGQLIVVANRHLGYHQILKRQFGLVELLGSNNKFVVFSVRKAG